MTTQTACCADAAYNKLRVDLFSTAGLITSQYEAAGGSTSSDIGGGAGR